MKITDILPVPQPFRDFTAVVVAVIDREGRILGNNKGLNYVCNRQAEEDMTGARIANLFMQPRFDTLLQKEGDDGGIIYEGLINMGDTDHYRSLTGSIYRDREGFIVLAEFDVRELEKLNETVIELNEETATVQRDLVRTNRELKRNEERIKELVRQDPLTELPNRRAFDERMSFELARTRRGGKGFSLAVLDIDHFKEVNDTHGHNAGDRILKFFSNLLLENMRDIDFFARIGGEEFAIIFPDTGVEPATDVAERLRGLLASSPAPVIDAPITASFGLTEYNDGEDSVEKIFERADQAMYESKDKGRNRVSIYRPD